MRIRGKISLACALSAVAVAFALPAAADARPQLGVNVANPFDGAQLAEAENIGAERIRSFLLVKDVQAAPGAALNASIVQAYKNIVGRLGARGIGVDFVVVGSAGGGINTPPARPADYADFMAKFAPAVAGRGVAYEIWNEPDEAAFWSPSPSAAAYAGIVKAAYPAIKQADPSATVVLGPTTGNNYAWIDQLYGHGVKGKFDAASVHTDTACSVAAPSAFYRENNRIGRFSFLGYKEVRATMLAHGDDKPLWVTEFGWSSTNGGPTSCQRGASAGRKASGVSEAQQAQFLASAVRCMSADPYVTVANWFTMRDLPAEPIPELRTYGLLRSNGSQKPAYAQMAGLLRGSISSSGACADLKGPSIQFLTPKANQKYKKGPLKMKLQVLDSSGLKGIRFYQGSKKFTSVNNAKIINSGKPISLKWHGAQCQKKGAMRIKAVAVDKLGNKEYAQVTIKKTSKAKKGKACKSKKKK